MVEHCGGHDHHGQADSRRQDPDTDVDDLGVVRSTEVQGFDRVADGDVTVHAHGGQGEDAGEHVVVVNGHDNLAQQLAKGPGPHQVVDVLEREGACGQGISQGQVEDVDVGGCLHFGVPGNEWRQTLVSLVGNSRLGGTGLNPGGNGSVQEDGRSLREGQVSPGGTSQFRNRSMNPAGNWPLQQATVSVGEIHKISREWVSLGGLG